MNIFKDYQDLIEKEIKNSFFSQKPKEIYEPINYILSLNGKRIRPALCLLSIDFFAGDFKKNIKSSLALEFFHNFTLIHDDIMDKAFLRKGSQSVHQKWDLNKAILSGDLLLIQSYDFFSELSPTTFYKVVNEFSQMAIKLCEGQQMDMNLEESLGFNFKDYLQMIKYKTASLIATSLKIGALIASVGKKEENLIYEVGENLGIAFQIQDDYLDVFGNSKQTGKKSCGDLYENKKTILYSKALEKANKSQRDQILYFYSLKSKAPNKKKVLKALFKELEVEKTIQKELLFYKNKALKKLTLIKSQNENAKNIFIHFIEKSISRTS